MGLLSHKARPAPSEPTGVYVRHRPETTLLYQIVQEYWLEFEAELASQGRYLPAYITKEFDEYLKCGRLEHEVIPRFKGSKVSSLFSLGVFTFLTLFSLFASALVVSW